MGQEIGIPKGGHLCLFWENEQEQIDMMSAFFRDGLNGNEKFVGILDSSLHKRVERSVFPQDQDIQLPPWKEKIFWLKPESVYQKNGVMSSEKFIETMGLLFDKYTQQGFSGIRLACQMGGVRDKWFDTRVLLDQEIQWERRKNRGMNFTSMCEYEADALPTSLFRPLIRLHPQVAFAPDWYKGFMADPVIHFERSGIILHANQRAQKIFPGRDWGGWVNFFDLLGPGDSERLHEKFSKIKATTIWEIREDFDCGPFGTARMSWRVKENISGIWSAYCDEIRWAGEGPQVPSPCPFCVIDLIEGVEVEVLQAKRDEQVKFRFHELGSGTGKFLIYASAIPKEIKGQPPAAYLNYLGQRIQERVATGVGVAEARHWVEWVHQQEIDFGLDEPLALWVGLWDGNAMSMEWAGDGLPMAFISRTPEGAAMYSDNRHANSGTWPSPCNQDHYLIVGRAVTGEPGENGEEDWGENQELFRLLANAGIPNGQLVVRLCHVPKAVGPILVPSLSQLGNVLETIRNQSEKLGWEKREQEILILSLSAQIIEEMHWDKSFKLLYPLKLSWHFSDQGVLLNLIANGKNREFFCLRKEMGDGIMVESDFLSAQ